MNSEPIPWWPQLFPVSTGEHHAVVFRVFTKQKQPFLALPNSARLAAAGLQLYPAQRRKARLLVKLLAVLFRAGLPVPARTQTLTIGSVDPLRKFMVQLSGGVMPPFAVLAGNPAASGRRFILMLWPTEQSPVVIKVGVGPGPAWELIEREENFLRGIPASVPGILRVIQSFRSERLAGFALPFLPGHMPPQLTPPVVQLLQGWLQPTELMPVTQLKAWSRLCVAATGVAGWTEVAAAIEAQPVATAVFHGDFTPWNVRIGSGITDRACALDWERGEFPGMPAWDWFHFEIQYAVLVRRWRGAALVRLCETVLCQEDFRTYAAAAGLAGRERAMLLAYLYHVVYVLKPTEGGEANRNLLEMLRAGRLVPTKAAPGTI